MPKAEVCERQMRDENGFKMHTQSESHFRQMLLVGEDPKKFINDYSAQFHRDFLQLLRTSHGEKMVHMNHFYQEYIHNKQHIHMNATKWLSLTEYAKYLGREGICRVEDNEKGIHIAWIDNSPEKLRRQDAIRKKERLDRGDEDREQMLIREQVKRAQVKAGKKIIHDESEDAERELKRTDGEKIKLSFGAKYEESKADSQELSVKSEEMITLVEMTGQHNDNVKLQDDVTKGPQEKARLSPSDTLNRFSMKVQTSSKPKNVFASAKKNSLNGKKVAKIELPKKMSEAERIMRQETERRSKRASVSFEGFQYKKQKLDS